MELKLSLLYNISLVPVRIYSNCISTCIEQQTKQTLSDNLKKSKNIEDLSWNSEELLKSLSIVTP